MQNKRLSLVPVENERFIPVQLNLIRNDRITIWYDTPVLRYIVFLNEIGYIF